MRAASWVAKRIANDETKIPGKNISEWKHSPFIPCDEYKYTSDIPMQMPLKNGTNGTKTNPYSDRPMKKERTKNKNVDESDVMKKSKLDFAARS